MYKKQQFKVLVSPTGSMNMLSQLEIKDLKKKSSKLYKLYRNCSLAILNTGNKSDNCKLIYEKYKNFEIKIIQTARDFKIELINPPLFAFIDGLIIKSIQENLFSVLRDLIYLNNLIKLEKISLSSQETTNLIFNMCRNASILKQGHPPKLAVCWGGHSINEIEYEYCKNLGFALGLRKIHICTGCGPGAMEAPMKGVAVGHSMQRVNSSDFIGLSEPSIIASEPPNPIVNKLLILPDIEKRLECFIRVGHAFIILPGGPGTLEELLYILGVASDKNNSSNYIPIILTGPTNSQPYFEAINSFLSNIFGKKITDLYKIILGDFNQVAVEVKNCLKLVKLNRTLNNDSYSFSWLTHINKNLQQPFKPTHKSVEKIILSMNTNPSTLLCQLRKVFSTIVSGNVKVKYQNNIQKKGPFIIHADKKIKVELEKLLSLFIKEKRMTNKEKYTPSYKINLIG
ncbi:nucleotide 5'-monophosphate nucleosidase PpnN [Paraphotobacterium marinum]|uniref:nucleotide 5'-monophosphate nucleosidase PpnN n=1 Tax=Paraphotobacterium marinum TaxID=1755811 RepID=UPI0039EBEE27